MIALRLGTVKSGCPTLQISLTDVWCDDVTRLEKNLLHNKWRYNGKNILWLQFNITCHQRHNAKKLGCLQFFHFHYCLNFFSGPAEDCYKEWYNLVMKTMVVEIRPRLARNIIFMIVVVSLLTVKCRCLWLWLCNFISVTKIHLWWISVFQRAPENKLNFYFDQVASVSIRSFRPPVNVAFSKWPWADLIVHPCSMIMLVFNYLKCFQIFL